MTNSQKKTTKVLETTFSTDGKYLLLCSKGVETIVDTQKAIELVLDIKDFDIASLINASSSFGQLKADICNGIAFVDVARACFPVEMFDEETLLDWFSDPDRFAVVASWGSSEMKIFSEINSSSQDIPYQEIFDRYVDGCLNCVRASRGLVSLKL